MKKTITFLAGAFLLLTTTAYSQMPEISATNQIPEAGDSITYNNANPFGFDPDGSGGAIDVLWDFSMLSPTESVDFFYVDMSETGAEGTFPSANIAMGNSSTGGYEFFEVSSDAIKRWGYAQGIDTIAYNEPFTRYSFPIQPGVMQSQNYTGVMMTSDYGQDDTTIENGNYQAYPDAYGTVILPPSETGGSPEYFDDVVRVHVNESFEIVFWLSGVPAMIVHINDDYYYWFDEETQEPIVIYGTTTDDAGGSPQTVLRYQPVAGTGTTGINDTPDISFEVFPNPANTLTTLSFKDNTPRKLRVISVLGETLIDQNTSKQKEVLDLSAFKPGVYFIEVNEGNRKQVKKIVVQ